MIYIIYIWYLYCFVPQQCHNSHFRPRNWDPISIQKPSSLHKDVQGLRCVPVFNTHLPMAGPCWECCWSEDFPGAKKAVAAHWCFCCVNCRLRTADVFVEWWILMDSILYIILFCITLYYIILYYINHIVSYHIISYHIIYYIHISYRCVCSCVAVWLEKSRDANVYPQDLQQDSLLLRCLQRTLWRGGWGCGAKEVGGEVKLQRFGTCSGEKSQKNA